jgi:hypothetical protein
MGFESFILCMDFVILPGDVRYNLKVRLLPLLLVLIHPRLLSSQTNPKYTAAQLDTLMGLNYLKD